MSRGRIDIVGESSDLVDNFIDHIDFNALFIGGLSGESVDLTVSLGLLSDVGEVSREGGVGESAFVHTIGNDGSETELEKGIDLLLLSSDLITSKLNETITSTSGSGSGSIGCAGLFSRLGGNNVSSADGSSRVVNVERESPEGVSAGSLGNNKVCTDGNTSGISENAAKLIFVSINLFRNAVKLDQSKVRIHEKVLLNSVLDNNLSSVFNKILNISARFGFGNRNCLIASHSRGAKA